MLIGNLGGDPELRYTEGGDAVANFSVATSESFTDRSGAKIDRVAWHRVVAWRKLGELCAEYLAKGRQVYVEGSIVYREWEDSDGAKRNGTEITAYKVEFLGAKSGGNSQGSRSSSNDHDGSRSEPEPPPGDDGIPF